MAKTDLSIKIGAEYIGKMAFAKAEKSVARLGKQVAGLALGGGILNFGISSVKAFYESEKSAKALYGTLNNLNLAYRKDDVNRYIDKLSLATGIVDETLNPAFQQFLLTTRDITKSQQLLTTALDISAGTGYDLSTVTKNLSAAYGGNKTALGKMQLGLTKAQIEANDFQTILKALNSLFAGQAASAASGYTGQIDKLNIAIDQLKENVGKGLVTGLSDGNGNIDQTAQNIAKLGTALGTASGYLAKFATGWAELFTTSAWTQFWNDLTGKQPAIQVSRGGDQGGTERAAQQRLDKAAAKTAVQQLSATKKLTAEQKAQNQLKKAQGILDTQQAGILAALQGKITDNEKLRLELQLALLTGNAKEADRLSNELLLSQARTTGLATFIASLPKALNPFADYPAYVQMALAELAKLAAAQKSLQVSPNKYDQIQADLTSQFIGLGIDSGAAQGLAASSARMQAQADAYFKANPNINPMTGAVINVQVEVGGQQITDIVTTQQLNNSASGSQSKLNRLSLLD
jgi:hypothetical protein